MGFGAATGYPAIILDESLSEQVAGYVFESKNLPNHWLSLDEFEGEGYVRTLVEIHLETGEKISAWVYALAVDESQKAELIKIHQKS